MKKISRLLLLLALVGTLLVWGMMSASAEELKYTDGYYTYTLTDDKATIVGVSTDISGDITIPETLGGYEVVALSTSFFQGCRDINSITIKSNITHIDFVAFSDCTVTKFIVENDNEYFSTDENGVLFNKDKTKLLSHPCGRAEAYTIPDSVVTISAFAFNDYNYESLVIPENVTSIGNFAFSGSTVKSLTIGKNVETIGFDAFQSCKVTDFTVDADNKHFSSDSVGVLYNKDKTVLIDYFSKETSYNIPYGVTTIRGFGYAGIENVTIPDSVETISNGAFEHSRISKIEIPDSVTSIGISAFWGCIHLEDISLPDNGILIDYSAFGNTPVYKDENNWVDGALYIDNYLVDTKESLSGTYTVKDGAVAIAGQAFKSDTLTDITLPDSVKVIHAHAFSSCTNLKSVNIPNITYDIALLDLPYGLETLYLGDGVKEISDSAFYHRENLKNVYIGNGTTKIGENAFDNCFNLTTVVIGNGVTTIEPWAFANCYELTNLTIGNSVKSMGSNCFEGCKKLTDIVIPESVKYIGIFAFSDTGLTSFNVPDTVETINGGAFVRCPNLTSLTIPDSVKIEGDIMLYDCTSLTEFVIPTGTTAIAEYAFGSCSNLKSITIPDTVTTIGPVAFGHCKSLTNIDIPDSVTSIKISAFRECTSLTSIIIPQSVTSIGLNILDSCNFDVIHYAGSVEQWAAVEYNDWDDVHFIPSTGTINCATPGFNTAATCDICAEWANIHADKNKCVFSKYNSDNNATCTKDGTKTAHCDNGCGKTRTIADANTMKPHNIGSDGHCSDCDFVCNCNCHRGGIQGFFSKIAQFFWKLFKTNKVCACRNTHY